MAIKMSELKLYGGLLVVCMRGLYGTFVGCFCFCVYLLFDDGVDGDDIAFLVYTESSDDDDEFTLYPFLTGVFTKFVFSTSL